MLEPPVFLPPAPALVRVVGEGEDSLGEVGAGGVVAVALLNTVLMLATLATLDRSANLIIISIIIIYLVRPVWQNFKLEQYTAKISCLAHI